MCQRARMYENAACMSACTAPASNPPPPGRPAPDPLLAPPRGLAAAYMRERETVRARAPVISEEIVRLQAQLSENKKERELRLALHGPIDEKGRPRKSRACELTVRSPGRPWPPASKRSLPEKVQVARLVPRLVLFEKSSSYLWCLRIFRGKKGGRRACRRPLIEPNTLWPCFFVLVLWIWVVPSDLQFKAKKRPSWLP